MADFLDGYVPVAERIVAWYALYPDGRIVADPPTVVDVAGHLHLASTARAYRTPDDPCPCQGSAFEPYPGKTNFTRDSEAQNAETAAVGRALALAGIEVKRGFASREEVRNRQPDPIRSVTKAQSNLLLARIKKLPPEVQDAIRPLVKAGPRLDLLPAEQLAEAEAFLELVELAQNGEPF